MEHLKNHVIEGFRCKGIKLIAFEICFENSYDQNSVTLDVNY